MNPAAADEALRLLAPVPEALRPRHWSLCRTSRRRSGIGQVQVKDESARLGLGELQGAGRGLCGHPLVPRDGLAPSGARSVASGDGQQRAERRSAGISCFPVPPMGITGDPSPSALDSSVRERWCSCTRECRRFGWRPSSDWAQRSMSIPGSYDDAAAESDTSGREGGLADGCRTAPGRDTNRCRASSHRVTP